MTVLFFGVDMLKQKSRLTDLIFLCVCATLVILLGVGIFLLPQKSYSEQENRALSSPPSFSFQALLNGSYFDSLSSFYSDHVPLRQQMISAKAICELCLGKRQNNGVIFSGDGTLTDRPMYDDTATLDKNLSAIKDFSIKRGAQLVTVPRSIDVRLYRLERSAQMSELCDQELLERLRSLEQSGNDPYYRTDHHLNADGILALYEHLSPSLGYAPTEVLRQCVSDSFLGSIYSRAGLIDTGADELTLLRYEGDEEICVRCLDSGCEQSELYDMSYLEKKDKYCVFLGGNHGLLEIGERDGSKPRLLLIKDSFANALIPLLARHFELTVVDPRYYRGNLTTLSENGNYDRILLLFGADTLATTGMSKSFAC